MFRRFLRSAADYFRRTDKILWLLTLTASAYGLLLIASQQRRGNVNFLGTQAAAVFIGYAAAALISAVDYNCITRLWWLFAGFSLFLTILVFFIGIKITGTDDVGWISLPLGMTFQPSELTKIAFIITFSKHLEVLDQHSRLKSFFGVISLLLHALLPVGLIHLQGDDGAALVFALMFIIMSFAAGVQLRYFAVLGAAAAAVMPLLWMKIMNSDQKNRLMVLFGTDDKAFSTYGWQQYQGKVSIASGGIFGKGLFSGPRVAADVVPYQENDFIFTVAGEELGFIGCAAIILLFVLILLRVLKNASRTAELSGRIICTGFFALVGTQAVINLGMVLGLLPVVGVTLPFFSSGGTSAACLYLGIGLVQSVYMHQNSTLSGHVRAELSRTTQGSVFAAM